MKGFARPGWRAREISQPRLVVFSANPERFQELGLVLNITETHFLNSVGSNQPSARRRRKRRDFRAGPGAAVTSTFQSLIFFVLYSCILGIGRG